jgi:hypothetical protein
MSGNRDEESEGAEVGRAALALVGRLLREDRLREAFLDDMDQRNRILRESNVTPDWGDDMLDALTRIRHAPSPGGQSNVDQEKLPEGWSQEMVKEWHNTCLEPFRRIRYSFWLSMTMSSVLFVVGISLFAVAAARSVLSDTLDPGALLIGGLGVVDFIALVYTRPLKDVSRTLASTQRAGILAMTYLAGLPLLRGEATAMKNLETLMRIVSTGPKS